MSVRLRAILAGVGFVLIGLLWFLFLYRPTSGKISEAEESIRNEQSQQVQLQAQLERLRGLQQQEPRLRAELARLNDSIPNDPRLPDLILQLQEISSLAGVEFTTFAPSLPAAVSGPDAVSAPGGQLQAISLSMQTSGTYFEILDFLVRLEHLRRATRISNVSLAAGGTAEEGQTGNILSVSFQMQLFMVAPAAAPPVAATPTPVPGATPVPGSTPTPAPTPTPVP